MSATAKVIDISDDPLLRQVAEAVRKTREPRLLRIGGENGAMIVPVAPAVQPNEAVKPLSEVDIEAFDSAFGAWRDNVDTEALKRGVFS